MVDISRFKVIYGDRIFNAVGLVSADLGETFDWQHRDHIEKIEKIDLLAINEDGNLISIVDKAWMFQFIPIANQP